MRLKPGALLKYPLLSEILKRMLRDTPHEFYEGKTSYELTEEMARQGVDIDVNDFYKYSGEEVSPIKTEYRNRNIIELPPNSQGASLLLLLKLIEEEKLEKAVLDGKSIPRYLDIVKKLYRDRDENLGDPNYMSMSVEEYLDTVRILGSFQDNSIGAKKALGHDTTFFIISDREGNTIGFIQSLFYPFGSGLVAKDILFQNRAAGFLPVRDKPNSPAPMKRPLHTLSITIVEDIDKKLKYIIGCAGGDYRPQIHTNIIVDLLTGSSDLWTSVIRPRILLREWYKEKDNIVVIEQGHPALANKPDDYRILVADYLGPTGVVQAAIIREKGVIEMVADPRGEGSVLTK